MIRKPLSIDIKIKDNITYVKTEFETDQCMAKSEDTILIRFPILKLKEQNDIEILMVPQSTIKIRTRKLAEEFIQKLNPFCSKITGNTESYIEYKNSKPDIPIMKYEGGSK
jgi:hypothetical protein